jgi:hypothetical protein
MLNYAGKTFIIVLLAPVICVGVVVMFVLAVCDFSASRLKHRFVLLEQRKLIKS